MSFVKLSADIIHIYFESHIVAICNLSILSSCLGKNAVASMIRSFVELLQVSESF